MFTPTQYQESVDYLRAQLNGFVPEALLILGSGLGHLADTVENVQYISYENIPHFCASTAPGHAGRLAAGRLSGRNVLIMQGRMHIYEGYTPAEVSYPVRVAQMLGATRLLLTCACGGVNKDYAVGDIAMLTDYINFTRPGPLVGMDVTDFEARFVDMSYAFDRDYLALAHDTANKLQLPLKQGVYFYMPGPQFETPAEIRAIRILGGDLVGMSSVFEIIMARRLNMRVAGFALVTNMAAGILDQPLCEEEVLIEGKKAAARFAKLLTGFLAKM